MAYRLGNRILIMGDKLFYASGTGILNPVWSGLTSYWRMETGTTVVDYGVNGYNGTSSNVSWVAGKNNNGAAFTSSDAKIVLADADKYNFERTDSFSFSLWVKRISLQNPAFLFEKQQASLSYRGYGMSITLVEGTGRHEVIFQLFNSTTNQLQVRSNQSLTSTTDWYHIVVTYNGSSLASGAKIYVNGVYDNYVYYNNLSNTTKNTTVLTIGNFETPITNNTIIDEFGVWNRALTQSEVTLLYNAGSGIYYPSYVTKESIKIGLTNYWRMDEANGTLVADAIGGVNGTAVNTNWNSSGIHNNCLFYNAIDCRVNCGDNIAFERTDSWSFSAWVKKNVDFTSTYMIISKQLSYTNGYCLYFAHYTQQIGIGVAASESKRFAALTEDSISGTSEWFHVVWTYAGTSNYQGNRIYVNGVNKTLTGTNTGTLDATIKTTTQFAIGNRGIEYLGFAGLIDEVGVWNRVLSQDEVAQLYNAGNGLFY